MSSTAPWYAAAATIVVLGAVGLAGGHGGQSESGTGPTPIVAAAETAVPGMIQQVQRNPGLCAMNISGGLRASGETAKAHAIDAACSAVETHRLTGGWPLGFAP
jgi:hypothetical protein